MKRTGTIRKRFTTGICTAVCLFIVTQSAWSQENQAPADPRAQAEGSPAENSQDRPNFRVGPVDFRVSAGVRNSYSDNINLSENNRREDLIFFPNMNIEALWPITELNTFNLNLGLGYRKHVFHPDADSDFLEVSPNSRIDFTFYAGDFAFTVYDNLSLRQDALDDPTINDTVNFARFENTAGLDVNWDINTLIFTAGYARTDWISLDNDFDFLERATNTAKAGVKWRAGPETTIGIASSVDFNDYRGSVQNDSTIIKVGPTLETRLTEFISLDLDTGWIYGLYDEGGTNNDSDDLNSFYLDARFVHLVNSSISHSLSVGRRNNLGTSSNYYDVIYVRHGASWNIIQDLQLRTNAFLEFGEESGSTNSEEFARWGGGLNLNYQITRSLSTGIGYNYIQKDSDRFLRDYYANTVFFDFNYRF